MTGENIKSETRPPRYGQGEISQRRNFGTATSQIKIAGPKNNEVYFDSNAAPTAAPTASHHAPRPVSNTLARKNSTKLAAASRSATSAKIASTVLRTSRASFGLMVDSRPAGPRLADPGLAGQDLPGSSLAPDEQSGHRVIPYHAHQRAGRTGQPPDRLLIVDRERHADIGEQADATHEVKQQEAAQDRKTLQPLVAIGEKIVQDEIAGHGDQRAGGLRLRKRHIA